MSTTVNTMYDWVNLVADKLKSWQIKLADDDLRQEVAVFVCEKPDMLDACENGHIAYVVASARNYFIDKGLSSSVVHTPRMRVQDSDFTKSLKLAVMHAEVSLNDECAEGYDYETILPCGKYEQADLWKKLRNERLLTWISENAPMLDFLLEVDKANTPAPREWNSKPIIRAYMGTDEIKRLLKVFGGALTLDERLAIEESMFRQFMHAKNAKLVSAPDTECDKPDFFMAM